MAYDLASNHRVASIGNNLYGGFLSVVQSPGKSGGMETAMTTSPLLI